MAACSKKGARRVPSRVLQREVKLQFVCFFACEHVWNLVRRRDQTKTLSIPASLNNYAIVTSPKINKKTCSRVRSENQHSSARQRMFR